MGNLEMEVNRYERLVDCLGSIIFLPSPQTEDSVNLNFSKEVKERC